MLAPAQTYCEKWQTCLDQIKSRTTEEEFVKWFKPIVPLELDVYKRQDKGGADWRGKEKHSGNKQTVGRQRKKRLCNDEFEKSTDMELSELQKRVDTWIREYGVRYFRCV